MIDIDIIKNCFVNNDVFYSQHALDEMRNEDYGRIFDYEVFECINKGEIIKE
jgi:hypothetical protein